MGWRVHLLLACLAATMFLPGQSRLPPVDRDESRYAQATSQMLETHDFVDVRFQNVPRYLQPAGIYWLQSLSATLLSFAGTRQIWIYRAPSLISACAAVLLTGWIGSMLFGPQGGVVAALLLSMSGLLGFEARMAKIDASLLAFTLAAQGALLRAYLGRAGRANAAVFWAALGAGLMLKGPIILIVSGATGAWLCFAHRRAGWLRRLHPSWGVLVTLAITLPWFVAIGLRTHGGFFTKAVGQNLLGKVGRGEQSHGSPPGYYLALFNLSFWPGALAVVFALPWAWRNRARPELRFLIAWTVPTWLMYEAIATKLPHYALPVYPALACLAAGAAIAPDGWRSGRLGKALAGVYALLWLGVGVALSFAGAYLISRYDHRLDAVALVLGTIAAALIIATLGLLLAGNRRAALASAGASALVVYVGLYAYSLPSASALWLSPRIAALVARVRPCPERPWTGASLASSTFREPSLVFLNGRDTRLVKVGEAADSLARDPACGMALVGDRQLPAFLARTASDRVRPVSLGEIDGVNYSNGRSLHLTLFKAGEAESPRSIAAPPAGARRGPPVPPRSRPPRPPPG